MNNARRHQQHTGLVTRAASAVPATYDAEARTVRVLWTTGATRRTYSWEDGEVDESLDLGGADLSAWDGAAVRDSHRYESALDQLGVIEPGTTVRTADGIESTVRFARTDEGDRAAALVADGITSQWSVGYDEVRYERIPANRRADVRGADVPLYVARSWRPRELSLVPVAADPGARTRSSDSITITIEEIDMSLTTLADDTTARAAEIDQAVQAERARIGQRAATIGQAVSALGLADVQVADLAASTRSTDEILSDLITKRQAQQEATNVRTQRVEVEVGISAEDKRRNAMVASILRRANPSNAKFAALDGAHEYRGSLATMMRSELHARGVSGALNMSDDQVARTVLTARAGSGMSLTDLPNVFLDAMNKSLLEAYETTARTYLRWAQRSDFRDFRDHHMVRLSDIAMNRTPKPEGGSFSQVKFTDKRNTASAKTYGLYWDITREMVVNDDLDAFSMAPMAVADSFADLENALVYGVLENNAALVDGYALFGTEHGNILSSYGKPGATIAQALAEHTYDTPARTGRAFNYQHVIVPLSYKWEAEQYYATDWVPATQAESRPDTVRGKTVTASEYLTTGAWYAAAAMSGIRYGYLTGSEGIQTAEEVENGSLTYRMWAWSDFGVGVRDHIGLVKILETSP